MARLLAHRVVLRRHHHVEHRVTLRGLGVDRAGVPQRRQHLARLQEAEGKGVRRHTVETLKSDARSSFVPHGGAMACVRVECRLLRKAVVVGADRVLAA